MQGAAKVVALILNTFNILVWAVAAMCLILTFHRASDSAHAETLSDMGPDTERHQGAAHSAPVKSLLHGGNAVDGYAHV